MSPETKILWLPASDMESRALFDYESNTFTGGSSSVRNPAGVRIDANTALNSTIVLACVRVLAEGLATLPLHVYGRTKDGGKETARTHPLYKVLHDRPNDWQTSFEWREMQMLHLGIYGQSFNEIIRDKRDIITALVPLHPSRMQVESVETGTLRYTYQEENGRLTVYPQDQIMHIRWMSNDGVNGMVPIELARDAIGLARACEIHGASFFANGARPGLVLSTDNTLSVEAAESLRVNWERVHRGPDRAQKTAVLTGGLKAVEFGNTNQESQFLETRRFQIEEICRLYRVPGSLVGDLSRSNFANIEQQSIDFVQFTLLPWLRRFESAFKRDLLGDDDVHFVEFDTRGLMRGDAAARASYYSTLHQLGVASVNELRAWENLNPVEGGDARFTPLNMQTLENASKVPEVKPEPPVPAASVGEIVAVLGQVAGGTVAPESAKAIMMAAFPALSDELAGKILSGVSGPPPEKAPEQQPERPAADVGGLVAILAQVKDGSLTPEAAVAAMGSVYPELPPETAQQIVAGVNKPPQPPSPPEQPAADVAGLLAILGQVSQGAVTPEAALSIIAAVFPTMSPEMAQAIVSGAKAQQPPPEAGPPRQDPPPDGGDPPPVPQDGGPNADSAEERAEGIGEGDWVSFGDDQIGIVDHVMYDGVLNLGDIEMPASPDAPAMLVSVWVDGDFDGQEAVLVSDATLAEQPDGVEGLESSRAFCPTGSGGGVDNSCGREGGVTGGVGESPGGGLSPPTQKHNIKLPKTPRRLTIDQSDSAMKQMGYEVGESETKKDDSGQWVSKTKYTDPDGNSATLTSSEVGRFVYANHSDPAIASIRVPVRRPRKPRRLPPHVAEALGQRAFCPGASPPDNSCSPTNKGDGVGDVSVSDVSAGSSFDKELHFKTEGGVIKVAKSRWSPADWSVIDTFVDEDKRRQGIASKLIDKVLNDLPGSISAQASSDNSVSLFWKHGFRTPDGGTLDEAKKRREEDSSVLLVYVPEKTGTRKSKRGFCPTGPGGGVDNSCGGKGDGVGPGQVLSTKFGMEYSPKNEKVVEKARTVSDEKWNTLPVVSISHGTTLQANEKILKTKPIDKVVSGKEPFREGYVTKLWRDTQGKLHVVDGHHRVAMYHALGKDMPARIMSQSDYTRLTKSNRAFCPGVSPPDNSCSPANKGEGGKAGGGRAAVITPRALKQHAGKVAGGSYVDGSIVSREFPNGAIVPRNPAMLREHHAKVKAELARRIDVPSDTSAKTANAASTVEELLADAREVVPEYKDLVEEAAKSSRTEASFGAADDGNKSQDYLREHAFGTHILKLPESVEGKVPRIRKEKQLPDSVPDSWIVQNELKDAVRGTLISSSPEALGDAVRSVRQQAEAKGFRTTIKNVFEQQDLKTGYGAVHMTMEMKTSSGRPVMTELQFHLRQAYDGNAGSPKDNSHGLYKPDPKTESVSDESAAAQMLIWSKAFAEVPPPPRTRKNRRAYSDSVDSRAFCPGASPPDNSCSPSNKGDGSRVQNGGRRVKFGTAASAALENMRKTGGFSVHPITGQSPTTGYMVSVKPESEVIYDSYEQVTEKAFKDFYESNRQAFADNPNLHFGGWVDTSTGKVYFDLSARFEDIDEAIDAAQETNQLAIWHLDEGKEIRREDYDSRRKRRRSVRSIRLSARGGRKARLQGDGGSVPDVREECDEGQAGAVAGRIATELTRSRRAFCPGASPPDNSCSPANKGSGEPAPTAPLPDGNISPGDTRGASGHSEEQRREHGTKLENWLLFQHNVSLRLETKGTYPTMDALDAISSGVGEIVRRGEPLPRQIAIQDMRDAEFAAYNFGADEVYVNADFRMSRIAQLSREGFLVSASGSLKGQTLLHESCHQSHFEALRAEHGRAGAIEKIRSMLGNPDRLGPTDEPWAPDARLSRSAEKSGVPLSFSEARNVAAEVSKYATANPVEFVAETRTGLVLGKKYSDRVMQLYSDYGGTPPGKPRAKARARKAA